MSHHEAIATPDRVRPMVTKAEVLEAIPMSVPTLDRLILKGQFPPPKLVGGKRYWLLDEILAWQAATDRSNRMPLRGAAKKWAAATRERERKQRRERKQLHRASKRDPAERQTREAASVKENV